MAKKKNGKGTTHMQNVAGKGWRGGGVTMNTGRDEEKPRYFPF